MIAKRYNELFNKFEALKEADAKYKVSLHNIAKVKKELKDIKNLGKLSSKESNVLFNNIKLNFNQINLELNHLRDSILTDQIFDDSEVEILSNKFEDIFNISQSLNKIKNVLDKKNIITDILYLELTQSTPPFSKIFKAELNNLLNEKKTTKGVNRDLINFKNTLDKYTDFDQKTFDEMKNKNGVDISVLLSNKKYIANILSAKQIDNVENYIKLIFTEINSFNEAFIVLLEKYQKHIKSSASQINKKIKENLENKTLKNEIILKDIETILNANKKAYEESLDKKEAEEERLRQDKEKQLISQKNAERAAEQAAEQARLKAKEKKQFKEGLYYLIGFIAAIAGIILAIWGVWELSVYAWELSVDIWHNYAGTIVNIIGVVLAVVSILFFLASKVIGVICIIATAFIYSFLDDLIPKTVIKQNEKTELVKEFKESSKKSLNNDQTNRCPLSGYKDNCEGEITYNNGSYNGFFKNNKRHGQGVYKWKDGTTLNGKFYNGNPSYGTYAFAMGDKYVGNFNSDWKRHGQGTYTWKNGNKYVGQWQNSKMHGQGTKTYKNGKIERGIWKNDKFTDLKSKSASSKNKIKAKDTIKSYHTNKCPSSGYKDNCKGKITYSNGDIYNGFFKTNKRHGKGTFIWKNGEKFTGTYFNGNPSYGTYAFSRGDKYIGNFKNWKMHGQGTYTWKNGDKYVGQWKNDKRHGKGTKTYKNGKIERGIWENGKFLYAKSLDNP